ncbi:hypothetical protein SDC9_145710 [bioreactor metagenome]|uniref:Uncharacterized protein n=1 Tax=bioreactor metagenome TaxID=1076179 RepID=A0A645ECY8_9ZZZZ
MAVGTEDHAASQSQRLAHIHMDDAQVRGNVDAAVFLRGGQAEHVIVFVDGTADRAEAVVAVGHRIGKLKLL